MLQSSSRVQQSSKQAEEVQFDMLDGILGAEKQFNDQQRRGTIATDYKRVQRRQGISEETIDKFGQGLERFRTLKKLGNTKKVLQNEDEFLSSVWVKQGHAHSDFDSERDGDPWDEYNKVDRFTSLEAKLAKKLNQYPHIDLHSKTPYLNDRSGKKDRKKEDPQQILYKKVAKEHRK